VTRFLPWIGVAASKFHDWKRRFGQVNEHNAWVPRDHWLTDHEQERIRAFARGHPREGYRRLTFMMLDADQAACSPASVYRVLRRAGLLAGQTPKPSKKGAGFVQPLQPHEHWHIDVSYLNVAGAFYFLCSILDGCSRFIVHWEIREHMEERDVQTILQRAREACPGATPRIISDNGPQFIAKDFKEFIRSAGMTHVKTSPYYPQSNGKIERWHKTLKGDCIRPKVPLSLDDARRLVAEFVAYYNHVRLHSALGYIAPNDRLQGRHQDIFAQRDRKLDQARQRRKLLRQAQQDPRNTPAPQTPPTGQSPLAPTATQAPLAQPTAQTPLAQPIAQTPLARNAPAPLMPIGQTPPAQPAAPAPQTLPHAPSTVTNGRTHVTQRPAIDFAALRASLRIADVLSLLGVPLRSSGGAQRRGPCPLHGSASGLGRAFSVNLHKHTFHCFKCGRAGNALDLWIHATRQSPYDAALDLCQRLALPPPTLTRPSPEKRNP
jgi:transposase InsO family protein